MYHIMIQGMEMVSGLITHYVVIEQIFVIEDSDHATAVKNSLLSLYTAVLDFLLEALKYFPPVRHEVDDKHWFRHKAASGAAKFKRAFQSLDPTSQAAAKSLLDTISKAKANVDADASHAYASKNMEILGEFGQAQDHILKHLESNGFGQEERDRRLGAVLAEFHDPLYSIDDKVSSLFDQMDKTQQRAEITSVLDWLSPATHESRRKTYHKRLSSSKHRLPASGRWPLDHPDYMKWEKSKASSVCCLSGIEGTGKTMLLSIVIDHLQTSIFSNADLGRLASFYASAREGTLSSKPDNIIRSIVRQLSTTQAGTLEPAAKQKYDDLTSFGNESPKPVMYECLDMIVALANEFPIIIVIDGLDELEKGNPGDTMQSSRSDLIESLKELMERTSNPVKLLFSAFSDGSAEARLRRVFAAPTTDDIDPRGAWHSIEVNADKNSHDLSAYVDFELMKRISSGDLLEGEVKAAVKARLLDRSNGMFRYATMQMYRLCDDRMDRTTVLEELDKPLPGITSFYDNSVDEIRIEKIDRVRITAPSTTRRLLCIQEPLLPVNAFLEAVSVEGGIDKTKESNLHSACRRLVKTDHYTGALMFTQPFVQEHLLKVPEYSESDCHLAATERCLRMMINAASSVSRLSATQVRFYWYAKLYWSLHYRNLKFNDATDESALSEERQKTCVRVRELARKFLMQGHKTSPAFNKWRAQIPDLVRELGDENTHSKQLKFLQASLEDPLQVICIFGLASVIEAQYKNLDFNQRSVHGQTAFCSAVDNNQLDTVRALLTHGRVDANELNVKAVHQLQKGQFASVIYYASALQAAAIQGSIPIIQTLLEYGARTGLVAGYYGSALQAACHAGREENVDFLLAECKTDVNSQGGYHGNVLQAAAARGHFRIEEHLLEAGACETASGGHFDSALMAATCAGSKEIIECLLAHTADSEFLINMKSQEFGTPLQRAVDMDRIDIGDLLIANDADINALGGSESKNGRKGSTSALAIAAWSGHNKIVSILCGLGAAADLSFEPNDFHLLPRAAICNMLDLVEYCLDTMTKVKDNDSNSLLHYVASRNHHEIAQVLLNAWKNEEPKTKVALIAATNPRGNTALQDALAQQHFQTVAVLLAAGARITPSARRNYFYRFSSDTSLQVVKQFIEAFDDHPKELRNFLNHRNRADGYSMLHDAAHHNRPHIAQLILQHGADATTMENEAGLDSYKVDVKTALHIAVLRGHRKIFDLLLSHALQQCDTDQAKLASFVNRQNSAGKTALVDAAERDRPEMMKILLEAPYNAYWSLTDDRSYNVLHYCAFRGHRTCVDILLHHAFATSGDDADRHKKRFTSFVNQQSSPDLITPLHNVTARGWRDIAMLLLETYRADYEVYDVHGDSMLHRAVQATHD
ncbi:MAG: hypothetical protein Q9173_003064 [Seirophora scorigena]